MVILKELILASVHFVLIQVAAGMWFEFDLVGTENSKAGLIRSDIRVTRKNRTLFSLQGSFELKEDLNNNFDCEGKLYYSSNGNNQYVLLPYKTARDSCCKHLENIYWTAIQIELEEVSDIPKRNENERLCYSYKQGNYTLRGFVFDKIVIPKHLKPGSYKGELITYKKSSGDVSKFSAIIRLY